MPAPDKVEGVHGVPLFLEQLCEQLRRGTRETDDIGNAAKKHGHDLLTQGFTVEQVVHDYGDVCQSITDLAVELKAWIRTDDFRTLNRCLDNAIAGAVTEFTSKQGISRDEQSTQLENLTDAAILAFSAIQGGSVGVGGSTGAVVERSLVALRAALTVRSSPPGKAPLGRVGSQSRL